LRAAKLTGGGSAVRAAREARNAQQLIAAAQATIDQGNAKLRALNASEKKSAKNKPKGKK